MHVVVASHQQLPAKGYGGPQRGVVALGRGLAAARHGSELFVYNGLDPAEYFFRRFPKRPEQYDLFLGKLHSAKGYHWAVEAAKRTGHPLIVAGGWRPSFTGSIKYVGEVDGATKAALP